jgi:hypothetical protein
VAQVWLPNANVRMKTSIFTIWIFAVGLGRLPEIRAQTNTNVVVAFATTNSTPLNSGFAGFTTELLGTGVEYGDTNMQKFAAMLSPGWLLFPAGTTGDAFDWSTGLTDTNWVYTVGMEQEPGSTASNLCQDTYLALKGKGGVWFTNFASLAANVGGARIIVCVNAFTDSANSAGAFAGFALSNHIPVAVWELCNEPYLFQGTTNFFTNGTDYANKMLPYRNAIKAADSNAVVAVFFTDPGLTGASWNKALGNYTNQYWDAVAYHHYPRLPTGSPFADLMAIDNGVLCSNTISYVTNDLMTNNNASVTYLMTEMSSALGDGNGTQNPPTSTLYGGIFASEYVMRLSTIPQVSFAGSYQLVNPSGVDTTDLFWNAVTKAATNGLVTNTIGLPFGYFLSAQGSAEAVAYWALNRSTAVYPTIVGANCPTVPTDTNGIGTMPAVYAQAYQGGNGKRYVVLTNKGSNAVPVQITQDGVALTNQLLETFVTGSDPSVVNSNPPTNNVVIQTNTVINPVTIPEFSVVRLEWTVFSVPQPSLSLTGSNPIQNLQWAGLTNVVYNVQGVTNLLGSWTTLGKVANAATNFGFTNWNSGRMQFYRLIVP